MYELNKLAEFFRTFNTAKEQPADKSKESAYIENIRFTLNVLSPAVRFHEISRKERIFVNLSVDKVYETSSQGWLDVRRLTRRRRGKEHLERRK